MRCPQTHTMSPDFVVEDRNQRFSIYRHFCIDKKVTDLLCGFHSEWNERIAFLPRTENQFGGPMASASTYSASFPFGLIPSAATSSEENTNRSNEY